MKRHAVLILTFFFCGINLFGEENIQEDLMAKYGKSFAYQEERMNSSIESDNKENNYFNKIVETDSYRVELDHQGKITCFVCKKNEHQIDTVKFRKDKYAGFSFEGVALDFLSDTSDVIRYKGIKDSIEYLLSYQDDHGKLLVTASVVNYSSKVFMPLDGIKLFSGVNTYMDFYPQWNDIFFPTMVRAEKTHLTSYFMTPEGKIIVIASPDPVASWCHEYESSKGKIQGKTIFYGGHRIYTTSFYLLHRLPLPQRHPQDLFSLKPNEKKTIRFYLKGVSSLEEVSKAFFDLTDAPTIKSDLYTLPENEEFTGDLLIREPQYVEIRTPRNEVDHLKLWRVAENRYKWSYLPYSGVGEYTVSCMDRSGKLSEMKLYVRPDFTFYLKNARKEALRSKPTTTHHAECFYPLYSYFLGRKYVPQADLDAQAEAVYDSVFSVLYDKEAGEMRNGKWRIQDAATMAGILADRYEVTGSEEDLEYAASLADYLIKCQKEDGGYYNPASKVHYTSVIYIAKSVMEVMNEEKKLAEHSRKWRKVYNRHKASVIRAIDDLALRGDNVETEGQMTFEDGMISCSVTQLGLAALKITDKNRKQKYIDQAIKLNKKHLCLTQSLIPDSRMNGATMRFWEYQYTVNLMHNGLNSPCGWSAWKYYGSWYLYLLTGDYSYLKEVINGLGSSMQLLDYNTGELRFGFLPDPYIDAYQFMEIPIGSRRPQLNRVILGEQYIPQISSWHFAEPFAWRKTKFGIDNFAHEVYKCMVEIFMENAYIIEIEPGILKGINCHLTVKDHEVIVEYDNTIIKNLHVNLKNDYVIKVDDQDYDASGLKWLIGYPNDLREF